jgi:hypothetical protein
MHMLRWESLLCRANGRRALLLGCALWLAAGPAARPARAVTFIEQAQRLERIYGALLDLRPGEPPGGSEHGIALGVELIPVPAIDTRVGSKNEPVHPPPAIPRARLRYEGVLAGGRRGAALGGMAGVTYEPLLTVGGYGATWLGGEAGLTLHWHLLAVAVRGYTLSAEVQGPITATGAADRFTLATHGADVRLGLAPGAWRAYAGYGGGELDAALRVAEDGARIRERGRYAYRLAGVAHQGERWLLVLEQQSTENYLRNVILAAAWRF